ncbi:MAG: ATP-binding protein, partial [Dolichospermum sp.]
PYKKSHSGLLIEAPSQILDLADFARENREDVKRYIERNLTPLTPLTPLPYQGMGEQENSYSPLLSGEGSEVRFTQNEDNFMYVQEILTAIANGFYDQVENINNIPPNLETYYQQ